MSEMLDDIQVLSRGNYLQLVVDITLLDDAIIRSNEPEEVLTHTYNQLGNRFILPWRKTKGKLRRAIMEKLRGLDIAPDCYLKDNLCMQCPACLMFGGTGEVSQADVSYNLLSRVMGDTFISTEEVGEIRPYTANAVDEKTLSTGQALMSLLKVPVETVFRGVVTLRDPTRALTSILADGLGKLTRVGASTREWGRVATVIRGCRLADHEELSSYRLALDDGVPDDLSVLEEHELLEPDEACETVNEQMSQMLEQENLAKQTAKGRGKSS